MTSLPARTARRVLGARTALLARRERGATAVEYALMVAFIAIVIVASVLLLGQNLSSIFDEAATSF